MDNTEAEEFGRRFKQFLDQFVYQEPRSMRPPLADRLREHLGVDPSEIPVHTAKFAPYDHANVHLALIGWFEQAGRAYELVGMTGNNRGDFPLAELLHHGYGIGPVDYAYTPISVDDELECVDLGFFLGIDGDRRFVVFMRGPNPRFGESAVRIDILAPDRESAKYLLNGVQELIKERNVFRGQVLSFEGAAFREGVGPLTFHRRPELPRDAVVLPDGLLDRVERQVLGIARQRETLRAADQHLRRGVLLYGPPGAGKTHTVRYLLSGLPDFTVLLLSGTSIHQIGPACALARMLQPALVVLEDCDLIAESRDFHRGGEHPLLFQVLNEMDGLSDDADVAFLLTTNRVDLLEPALAQRPGRVDLAIEIPLPDMAGRRRLLELYGGGLDTALFDGTVERTEGTTASFAKELVRRVVLFAAERGASAPDATDVNAALDELLSDADEVTRRLLGTGAGQSTSENSILDTR
jgi:cell division protease FtsH